MVQTVLREQKREVLWATHYKPGPVEGSSFHACSICVTNPYIGHSSKYRGWGIRLKNKTPGRKKIRLGHLGSLSAAGEPGSSRALKPSQALPLIPSAPRI